MAYLQSKHELHHKLQVPDYLLIGSDEHCQWQTMAGEARHARIEKKGSQYILKDLRSSTGTFINNQRVFEAPLKDGDWIQIGGEELLYVATENQSDAFPLTSKNAEWNLKLQQLGSVSKTQFPILILGPSGAGKEVIAKSVHQTSERKKGPFVSVNCSALSESLIESELFGHVKGSFTGAINDRKGAFEAARCGTLFLDEIGDLPISLQAKLLRALENNEIRPVGSDSNVETDIRIVAATHQNLLQKIKRGEFRADLYYRLNVINIEAPSLFDRLDDFEDLLYHFAKDMRVRFSHDAVQRLKKHPWPGNIRELKNTVARASATFPGKLVDEKDVESILDRLTSAPDGSAMPLMALPIIKEMEKQMIIRKLAANKGNQKRTAQELGLPKSTLHDRLKSYQIDAKSFAIRN